MTLSILEGDYHVRGSLSVAGDFAAAAGSITNEMVKAAAGLDVSKMDHRIVQTYAQPAGDYAYDAQHVIHIAKAAGTISGFKVFIDAVAVGDSIVEIDILKADGAAGAFASILTSVFEISALADDDEDLALTVLDAIGNVSPATYVANAVFAIKVDVSVLGGTVPTGLVVQVTFDEEAQ